MATAWEDASPADNDRMRSCALCEQRSASAELATVDGDGDGIGDDEDADEPGEGDPDVTAYGFLGEQGPNGVHNRGHGLVLGEPGDRGGHRVGGYEPRPHEGQADQREAECRDAGHER